MNDHISRETAVTLLRVRAKQLAGTYGDLGGAANGAAKLICEIPPADVRPIIYAEWEPVPAADGGTDFRCSACKKFRFHNGAMRRKYFFCPKCGAEIKEKEGASP